jgi:competence protein ComEA
MRRSLRAILLALSCATWLARASPVRADAVVTPAPSPAALSAPGVVNINTASAEELERLPGIGPTRARAILELRARVHRFLHIEALLRVKGIGRATFRKLKPWLVLEGPTTLAEKRARSRHGP